MDQRIRKLMTMHKALHPRDDIDRLHMSRKKKGRGQTSIEDSVDALIQQLKEYIKKCMVCQDGTKKTMNYEADSNTNCNWCAWNKDL